MEQALPAARPERKLRPLRSFPHHLVLDILLSVPAKPLANFRLVCKSWLSSTTDPAFIAAHTVHQVTTSPLPLFITASPPDLELHHLRSRTTRTLPLPHSANPSELPSGNHIVRSVNGLILLYSGTRNEIHVFNPLTREIAHLPPPPITTVPVIGGFDTPSLGFGVDMSTGKCKVVQLVASSKWFRHCSIFTLGSHSWRAAECRPPVVRLRSDYPVCWKGVLYWITHGSSDRPHGSILSFDLGGGDEFVMFSLPPLSGTGHVNVEVLHGSLCVVDCPKDEAVEIWILEEGGEHGWQRGYTIKIEVPRSPVDGALMLQSQILGIVRVIAIQEGEFLLATEKELFSYDPKSKGLQKLLPGPTGQEDGGESSVGAGYWQGVLCAETLAPVALCAETVAPVA